MQDEFYEDPFDSEVFWAGDGVLPVIYLYAESWSDYYCRGTSGP